MIENLWEKKYSSNSQYRNKFPYDIIVSLIIKKFRKENRKLRVLELGCGCGNNLIPLSNYFEYAYGVDVSETVIKFANDWSEKERKDNLNFICKDLNEDFFIDTTKKFDLIFDRSCLSLLIPHRLEKLIEKITSKYLEKEGNLFLSLYADTNSSLELKKINSSNYSKIGNITAPEVYYYSRKDLISLTKFNLELEQLDYISNTNMLDQKYIITSEWNVLYKKL